MDDWQRHTMYKKCVPAGPGAAPQIAWFWRVVRELDHEQRSRLLQFVTGTCRVPVGGFAALSGALLSLSTRTSIYILSSRNLLVFHNARTNLQVVHCTFVLVLYVQSLSYMYSIYSRIFSLCAPALCLQAATALSLSALSLSRARPTCCRAPTPASIASISRCVYRLRVYRRFFEYRCESLFTFSLLLIHYKFIL